MILMGVGWKEAKEKVPKEHQKTDMIFSLEKEDQ